MVYDILLGGCFGALIGLFISKSQRTFFALETILHRLEKKIRMKT